MCYLKFSPVRGGWQAWPQAAQWGWWMGVGRDTQGSHCRWVDGASQRCTGIPLSITRPRARLSQLAPLSECIQSSGHPVFIQTVAQQTSKHKVASLSKVKSLSVGWLPPRLNIYCLQLHRVGIWTLTLPSTPWNVKENAREDSAQQSQKHHFYSFKVGIIFTLLQKIFATESNGFYTKPKYRTLEK